LLGTFNLLPLPPLDGSTGVGVLMSERTALRFFSFMHQPMFQMMGMMLAWVVFYRLFDPIFIFSLDLLYPGSRYR